MKVRETGDGEWIVVCQYDGLKLAGPFETRGEAYEALDTCTPAVVRMIAGGGFEVRHEDTEARLAGPFRDRRQADDERMTWCEKRASAKPRRGRPPKAETEAA